MGLLEDLFQFITGGAISGIPSWGFMIIPFVLGLVAGFFIKKVLKLALIAIVILFVLTYVGILNFGLGSLEVLIAQYGPIAIQYAAVLLGLLPLSLGFAIGAIIGFLVS